MREHLAVIDAIERRDPDGAVAALTRHINNARSRRDAYRAGERQHNGEETHEHHTTQIRCPARRGRGRRRHHARRRARRP